MAKKQPGGGALQELKAQLRSGTPGRNYASQGYVIGELTLSVNK